MKHTLSGIYLMACIVLAIPCHAQWKWIGTNIECVGFGLHDSSFFVSLDHRIDRIPGGTKDTGLDFTEGNFTTFASAGPNFFAGSYNSTDDGNGEITTNNGSSWKLVIGGAIGSNGTYVFGHYGHHLARSTDVGNSWQHLTYPDGTGYVGTGAVVYMCTSEYWASTSSAGFWRSLDSGYTWAKVSPQPPFQGTLMTMGTLLFMYQSYVHSSMTPPPYPSGVLMLSRDSGIHWDTVPVDSAGIPEFVMTLATDGKNLFAGCASSVLDQGAHFGNGVYVSTDTGQHWRAVNDGLSTTMNVEAIGIFPIDSSIYLSTNNNNYGGSNPFFATYRRPINEVLDTNRSAVRSIASVAVDSIEIFPNPVTGIVTILAGGTSIMSASVLNVLGEQVLGIPNCRADNLTVDISNLPSGTYFLHIQSANGNVLRKIVKE